MAAGKLCCLLDINFLPTLVAILLRPNDKYQPLHHLLSTFINYLIQLIENTVLKETKLFNFEVKTNKQISQGNYGNSPK